MVLHVNLFQELLFFEWRIMGRTAFSLKIFFIKRGSYQAFGSLFWICVSIAESMVNQQNNGLFFLFSVQYLTDKSSNVHTVSYSEHFITIFPAAWLTTFSTLSSSQNMSKKTLPHTQSTKISKAQPTIWDFKYAAWDEPWKNISGFNELLSISEVLHPLV